MAIIRQETEGDAVPIRHALLGAFPSDVEARLVENLRANRKIVVGLVAEIDGEIAGHIAFSAVTSQPPLSMLRGAGLAPVAVVPEFQGRGIGTQLINEGLARCASLGFDFVVVLGEPAYYRRFGFFTASLRGLRNVYGADEAFMALEIRAGCLEGCDTLIRYCPEFDGLEP